MVHKILFFINVKTNWFNFIDTSKKDSSFLLINWYWCIIA